jgi:PEP-CTERM motif
MQTNAPTALLLGFLALLGAASTASADPITVDSSPTWYDFQFLGPGSFATAGIGQPKSQPAPNPPWTFTSASFVNFTVTDAFFTGDSFNVFDFGVLIGMTPSVPAGPGSTDDPDVAVADPSYSHATFSLAPGSHSITIQARESPFGAGGAYFKAETAAPATPEPASLTMLGLGVLGFAGYAWRRRKLVMA